LVNPADAITACNWRRSFACSGPNTVPLLSPYYIASDYCRKDMEIALQRDAAGQAAIVPSIGAQVELEGGRCCLSGTSQASFMF
jgi:hypothetical protein